MSKHVILLIFKLSLTSRVSVTTVDIFCQGYNSSIFSEPEAICKVVRMH